MINAPLIIQGTTLDSADIFSERNIICIGSVSPVGAVCNERYNLEQLQEEYVRRTNTNKIILINPNDWTTSVSGGMFTDSSYIQNLYTKTSLVAPILASAKHEVILSTTETNYENINSFLKSKSLDINYLKMYLTIMAAPNVIPHRKFRKKIAGHDYYWALDASYYADINKDNEPDIAIGRIAGISNSDVSSYTARSIFYSDFIKTDNTKFLASSFGGVLAILTDRISYVFDQAGYNSVSVTTAEEAYDFNPTEWKNQDLIFYTDHGASTWAGIFYYEIPKLKNSFVLMAACSTTSTYDEYSFWAHSIREGAIGFVGAVSTTAFSTDYITLLNKIYYENSPSVGDAFKNSFSSSVNTAMTTLIGDPTLNLNPKYLLPQRVGICMLEGEICFSNNQCCSGRCSWFTCKDCKTETQGCVWNSDCCDGLQCSWFKCKDCKVKSSGCIANSNCCSGLQCSWFSCVSLIANGKHCSVDGDCVSGKCSKAGYNQCVACGATDTSCGVNTCENCVAKTNGDLYCKSGNVRRKGFECGSGDYCVQTKSPSTLADTCAYGCSGGACKACRPKGTFVAWAKSKCCSGKVSWWGGCK